MGKGQPSDGPSSATLRPVIPDDDAFLREVYASTRAEELAGAGLTAAQTEIFITTQFNAQTADYRRRFPNADLSVVLHQGVRMGRFYVSRSDDEVRILDLTLLPAHRNIGIGTGLIEQLLTEARQCERAVRIYLDNGSQSVRLFERLGFSKVEERDFVSLFEWRA